MFILKIQDIAATVNFVYIVNKVYKKNPSLRL